MRLLAHPLSAVEGSSGHKQIDGVSGYAFEKRVLPTFPWVGDRIWSSPEGDHEGHGPVFSDSGAERPVVCW